MKKIRIGNDIVIKWRITINGEEVNLEGLDLSLYISTTYQPRKAIAFTVAGNEITATYKGTAQKVTGIYRLTLYRNEGDNSQSILDACDAFELVSCSCLTTDVAFGGAEVELPIADLGIGVPGLSAYEIAVAEGFKGTQAEWIASLSAASEAAAAECREFTDKAKISEQERQDREALRVTAEDERAANERTRGIEEQNRVSAESLRASAEVSRKTAEEAREADEQQRSTAEVGRSSSEELRKSNEQSRISEETTRSNNEAARIAAETKRANAELTRKNNEDARQEAERGRVTAETARQSSEADRATNESNRATAEQQRVTNETARKNAESSRATAETARQEAETARQEAETARQEAEQGRVTAEQQRADAEAARAEEFATFEGKIAAKEDAANKVTSIGADANNTTFPTTRAVLNSIAEVKNIEVTPEMLSESTKQYINASGGGTITNLADDEDLTSVDNVLKLADKDYSPTSYSGMGRVYLRKNMVDGKNILTQEMMTKENTIYIIQYDYDLNGATINVPSGCVLDFQGGSFVNGTINFNDTYIEGFSNSIKCLFSGTIKSKINVCLFGVGSTTEDRLQDLINIAEKQSNSLYFPAGKYNINKKYNFRTYLNIVGDGEDTIFDVDDNCGFYCVCENKSVSVRLYLNNFMALGKYTTSNNTITSKFIVQDCLDSDIKENTDVSFPWINNSNISHCIFKYFYTVIEWKYGFYWGKINNNWFSLNYIGLYLANANSVNISQNSFRDNYDTDIILTGSKKNAVNSGTSIFGNDFSGARYAAINIVNGELHYGTIRDNYIECASGSRFLLVGGKYGEDYNAIIDGSRVIKRVLVWKSHIINPMLTYTKTDGLKQNTIYCDEGRMQFCVLTGNLEFNMTANNAAYYKNQSYKNVLDDSYIMQFNANVYRGYYRENLTEFSSVNKINHMLYDNLYVPVTPVYNGIAAGEETCIREFSGWVSIPAQSSIVISELGTVTDTSFNTSRVYIEFFNSRNPDIVLLVWDANNQTTIGSYESKDFRYMKNMYSLHCRWDNAKPCYIDTDIATNTQIKLYNKSTNALASYVTIKIYAE